MRIKATFKGKNSLGYVNGKEYELKIVDFLGGYIIRRIDNTGLCPYQSETAFLNNWSNIKILFKN
jgi:hypothetical protein